MKQTNLIIMSAALALTACNGPKGISQNDNTADVIGRSELQIENRRFTPEALWAMGRIGQPVPSPDGKQILYTVTYYSVKQNKSNTELFVMNADGSQQQQLTQDAFSQSQPAWTPDGKQICYLNNESGSMQLWQMNPDGSQRQQLTHSDNNIEGFLFAPDGKKLIVIMQVKTKPSTADTYPDLPQASGVIIDDLMYKHWDEWVTTAPHPFLAELTSDGVTIGTDLLEGTVYECPMKPFGGIEQLAWSPNSDLIAYTCRKKVGLDYATSTDSDIYLYHLDTGKTENLCKDYTTRLLPPRTKTSTSCVENGGLFETVEDRNMGYDINPRFSPDGRYIAWQSMERDGYESDLNRLYVLDLQSKQKYNATAFFDTNVDSYVWAPTSDAFFLTAVWHGTSQIYRLGREDWRQGKMPIKMTDGQHDYSAITLCGDKLIAPRHSMSQGDELYAIDTMRQDTTYATVAQLTQENKHIYDQVDMGQVEARWIPTTDGKQMLTWIIYPPHFDPKRSYPTLLYCEGGPQTPLSQFWSYRWNFQLMAANDYIIVAPCRRGMPGFGHEWNEAISGDYGGQCMKDYFTAIDALCREPYVDRNHLGCVGASFGGYSVYWIAGHHENRFKAFIAHDGIFNMEMQYLETEEKWFANWDMGGAYWEKGNATAQRTFANSPHRFVDRWTAPILCIHGEKDYRILANQAMAAFDAAKLRGIPAELLIFPDENHWVLQPQNGILWQRVFFNWLDRWLKPQTGDKR